MNEQQYLITKQSLNFLLEGVFSFDMNEHKSPILAKAELEALYSEIVNLLEQIKDYKLR
jgi:hypothetical protein